MEHIGEKLLMKISLFGHTLSLDINALFMSWIVMAIMIIGALLLRKGLQLKKELEEIPTRRQCLLEMLVELLQTQLGGAFQSWEFAAKLFPLLATLGIYILLCNWLGVIPGFSSPTADINFPLSLGLMIFFLSHYYAVRRKGAGRYIKEFFEPYAWLFLLNIVSEIAKPISHSFRLFGNLIGGAILIQIMSSFFPLILPVFLHAFYGLFIGAIQAMVFVLLAAAYITVAAES